MGYQVFSYERIEEAYFVHAEIPFSQEEYEERDQWCKDNLVGGYHHSIAGVHCYEGGDVILFMGRWC